jgi:putative MFS transporter
MINKRPGDVVAYAVQASLPSAAADELGLWLDHFQRRGDRLHRVCPFDRQGRSEALVLDCIPDATVPLLALAGLGATSAIQVLIFATAAYAVLQTIAFSLYLYSAELYPTRLRAVGTGFGSAWLRAGSSIGPILVGTIVADLGIQYVFAAFAAVRARRWLVTLLFAIETKGRVLEELSP